MEEKTICFACGTEFHLLVSYILSTTIYSKNRKIIFLYKEPRLIKYIDNTFNIDIWDDVVIIDPSVPMDEINNQIKYFLHSIDTLHFFSIGFFPFNQLFIRCCEQGKKIILTDEGIGSYLPFQRFSSWIERYDPQKILTAGVDLKRVDEIWLFNPLLFLDETNIILKKIDIQDFYNACRENYYLVDIFKKLFNINEDISFEFDFVYFRQYYSLRGDLSTAVDSFLDCQICGLLEQNKVFIKDHPAFPNNPYKKFTNKPFSLNIPWEVLIILNKIDNSIHIKMPQVYISATSSAMFNTNTLGLSGDFIFINNIFELYTGLRDETIKELINASKQIFPNSHFYEPINWREFYNILFQINKKYGFQQIHQSLYQITIIENEWLREQYKIALKRIKEEEQTIMDFKNKINKNELELEATIAQVIEKEQTIQELTSRKNKYPIELKQKKLEIVKKIFTQWKESRIIKKSGLFDSAYYLQNNPDVRNTDGDPLLHFIEHGWKEGRNPSPDFETNFYLSMYPDVKKSGMNPLVHFIVYGTKEGRSTKKGLSLLLLNQKKEKSHKIISKVILTLKEGFIQLFLKKTIKNFYHKIFLPNIAPKKNIEELQTIVPVEQVSNEPLYYKPLISVLIPTYNTPVQYLRSAIDSVRNQLYPNWEICICDDNSTNRETLSELHKIANSDTRINVIFLSKNEGISTTTNKAAKIAKGDFFAFLDHDDELTTNALYEIALALNKDKTIDVIYSDQDKIDAKGNLLNESFFKPDWSPIYLLSVMYIGHLLVVKRELYERLNGMNAEFDGVQDFEFMLRVTETNPRVKHIPRILYHWRKIPGSVAMGLDEKGEKIEELQVKAVNAYLSRQKMHFFAQKNKDHRHRVKVQPQKRETFPLVSIIIPSKDAPKQIKRCLQSIFARTTYLNYEIIVIDNGTTDKEALQILTDNRLKVIPFNEKFNYSKANNLGVKNANGEYVILLNNDIEVVTPDWIEQLLCYCELPEIGAVGPLLLYPDQTVQHAGVVIGMRGTADHVMRHYHKGSDGYAGSLSCTREVSAVTGACMMLKRRDYFIEGGLIEYYGTHYQDVDLCLRLQSLGKHNLYVPYAELIHYESSTRGTYYDYMDRALLLDIWGDLIVSGDPFYNPNFSLDEKIFYKKSRKSL